MFYNPEWVEDMTERNKPGKHAAALPQPKAAVVGKSEAKAVAATNPEREKKFATKNDLKQLKKLLVAKMEHGFQLILQQLRFEVTNLTQKIDSNDARNSERSVASDARFNEKFDELRSEIVQLRSDMDKQFEAKDKIDAERSAASEARINERFNHLETLMKQESEKNLYKFAVIVTIILGAMAAVYQLFIKVFM